MQLDIIAGSTTQSLTDGTPYALESAHGLGVPHVQRFLERTPLRDGATDRGYALHERVVTLSIRFTADDAEQRDERRDTLQRLFAPGTNMPLVLQATRADGEVRQLDVVASGLSDIALEPAHDVAHLHRVVVQLRAEDPYWYDGEVVGAGTLPIPDADQWDTIYGLLPGYVTYYAFEEPGSAQSFAMHAARTYGFYGTIPITTSGSVLMQSFWTYGTAKIYAATNGGGTPVLKFYQEYRSFVGSVLDTEILERDNLYHSIVIKETSQSVQIWVDDNPVFSNSNLSEVTAGTGYWRPDWGTELDRAASYDNFLSSWFPYGLQQALGGTTAYYGDTEAMVYANSGSVIPTVTLLGPIESPILTNQTTGRKLDLTGVWVPHGKTYAFDVDTTGYGFFDTSDNTTIDVTDDSNLTNWYLVSGTNTIHGSAHKLDQDSRMTVSWRGRQDYEAT